MGSVRFSTDSEWSDISDQTSQCTSLSESMSRIKLEPSEGKKIKFEFDISKPSQAPQVIGQTTAKLLLQSNILGPNLFPVYQATMMQRNNGFILYGPPGKHG